MTIQRCPVQLSFVCNEMLLDNVSKKSMPSLNPAPQKSSHLKSTQPNKVLLQPNPQEPPPKSLSQLQPQPQPPTQLQPQPQVQALQQPRLVVNQPTVDVVPIMMTEPLDGDELRLAFTRERNLRPDAFYLNRTYTDRPSSRPDHSVGCINPEMRGKLATWMVQLCVYFDFESTETLGLAMNYLDRYCSRVLSSGGKIMPTQYQLLGAACLMLATKLREYDVPKCSEFVRASRFCFQLDDLKLAEETILATLEWRLDYPTATLFLHTFLTMFPVLARNPTAYTSVFREAEDVITLAYCDYHFLQYPGSVLSLSAIKFGMLRQGFSVGFFEDGLIEIIKVLDPRLVDQKVDINRSTGRHKDFESLYEEQLKLLAKPVESCFGSLALLKVQVPSEPRISDEARRVNDEVEQRQWSEQLAREREKERERDLLVMKQKESAMLMGHGYPHLKERELSLAPEDLDNDGHLHMDMPQSPPLSDASPRRRGLDSSPFDEARDDDMITVKGFPSSSDSSSVSSSESGFPSRRFQNLGLGLSGVEGEDKGRNLLVRKSNSSVIRSFLRDKYPHKEHHHPYLGKSSASKSKEKLDRRVDMECTEFV